MKSEEKISRIEFACIAANILLGTLVRSVFTSSVTENESWLTPLTGLLPYLPMMAMFIYLAKKHPGKNLFEINEAVFGKILGKFVSILYSVFFITVCSINIGSGADFVTQYLMHETPQVAIMLLFMTACCYAVRKGVKPIAMVSVPAVFFSSFMIVLALVIGFKLAEFENLLPVFNRPFIDYVQSSHITATVMYGESIFGMMFLGMLKKGTSVKKHFIVSMIYAFVILLLIHIDEILTLGPLIHYISLPAFESVRIIELGNSIASSESIFALLLMVWTFFKVCIMFLALLIGVAQITSTDSYKPYVFTLAVIIVVYAMHIYEQPSMFLYWGKNVLPFVWSIYQYGIIGLTALVTFIKSRSERKAVREI